MRQKTFQVILLSALIISLVACQPKETYTVLTYSNIPPFSFLNTENQNIGFDIDVMKAIAKKAGFNIFFENYSNEKDFVDEMYSCKQDTIFLGFLPKWVENLPNKDVGFYVIHNQGTSSEWVENPPPRESNIIASNAIISKEAVIVLKKDNNEIFSMNDLENKVIGIESFLKPEEPFLKRILPSNLVVSNGDGNYIDLLEGRIDALLDIEISAIPQVQESKHNFIIVYDANVYGSHYPFFEVIGVCDNQGDSGLVNEINTALEKLIADGTINEIKNYWLESSESLFFDSISYIF